MVTVLRTAKCNTHHNYRIIRLCSAVSLLSVHIAVMIGTLMKC